MKRILYLSANSKMGGAETLTSLMMCSHNPKEFTSIGYFFNEGPFVDSLKKHGIACHVAPGGPPRLRHPLSVSRATREIVDFIRSEKIDFVHSVMGYAHLFGGRAARQANIPCGWFQHGPTGTLDWLTGRVYADVLWTNSTHTLEAQNRYHARAGRIEVIYPSTGAPDPARWAPIAKTFRDGLGFEDSAILIGLAARITPLKGHFLLVQAAVELIKMGFPRHRLGFVIIGDPFLPSDQAYLKALHSLLLELEIVDLFRFCGHLDPPFAAIGACDIVINASISPEGFGLSLVEAMHLEKAVVAPAEGGPLEIIEAEKTGLLFEPREPLALATQLLRLAQDPALRLRLGTEARRETHQRFSPDRLMKSLEASYHRVLGA